MQLDEVIKNAVFGALVLVVVGFGVFAVYGMIAGSAQQRGEIIAMGYDYDEVSIFLDNYRYSREEFLKSKGVRAQFERFESGNFPPAANDNSTANLALGVAVGSAIAGSGRR